MKKFKSKEMLNYLIDYIILSLNEFQNLKDLSDFGEGSVLAYIECLEVLSQWKGFKKYGITDVEEYFGLK